MKDPKFIEKYYHLDIPQEGIEAEKVDERFDLDLKQVKLDNKKYYPPGDVLYELSVPRDLLKKNQGLKAIHKLI